MARKNSSMIGTAGEHYVAFRLSQLGLVVALPRAGTPGVDLLVSNRSGTHSIAIQVKTAKSARYLSGRKPNKKECVTFVLGVKTATPNLWYAFVDLQGVETNSVPDVYIVPWEEIHRYCSASWVEKAKYVPWNVAVAEVEQFKNNWKQIENALTAT